jgi:uncharacterized protein YegP (UPF0339 family)
MRDEYDFTHARPNPYAQRLASGPLSTPATRAGNAPRFEVYQDSAGQHRWRLIDANGHILSISAESFDTADACRAAIAHTRNATQSATTSAA